MIGGRGPAGWCCEPGFARQLGWRSGRPTPVHMQAHPSILHCPNYVCMYSWMEWDDLPCARNRQFQALGTDKADGNPLPLSPPSTACAELFEKSYRSSRTKACPPLWLPPETEELQKSPDQRHIPRPIPSRARKCGEADFFFARVSLPLPAARCDEEETKWQGFVLVGNRSGEAGPSRAGPQMGPFRIRSAWAAQSASACLDLFLWIFVVSEKRPGPSLFRALIKHQALASPLEKKDGVKEWVFVTSSRLAPPRCRIRK